MTYHQLMLENQTLFTKKIYEQLHDLSSGQPKVLEYLLDHEGCMQKEIAHSCLIEPASVTSLLNKMEKDHLVTRQIQDGNRRNLHVFLTKKGKEKAIRVKEVFTKMEDKTLEVLSPEELDQLLTLLGKVNKNLWNM